MTSQQAGVAADRSSVEDVSRLVEAVAGPAVGASGQLADGALVSLVLVLGGLLLRVVPATRRWASRQRRPGSPSVGCALSRSGHGRPRDDAQLVSRTVEEVDR